MTGWNSWVGFDEIRRTKNEKWFSRNFQDGKYAINPELFFQLDEGGRRGHDLKLLRKDLENFFSI